MKLIRKYKLVCYINEVVSYFPRGQCLYWSQSADINIIIYTVLNCQWTVVWSTDLPVYFVLVINAKLLQFLFASMFFSDILCLKK